MVELVGQREQGRSLSRGTRDVLMSELSQQLAWLGMAWQERTPCAQSRLVHCSRRCFLLAQTYVVHVLLVLHLEEDQVA